MGLYTRKQHRGSTTQRAAIKEISARYAISVLK